MNGFLVIQIQLKGSGIDLKEAFNQIERYRKHSFTGLYRYTQVWLLVMVWILNILQIVVTKTFLVFVSDLTIIEIGNMLTSSVAMKLSLRRKNKCYI